MYRILTLRYCFFISRKISTTQSIDQFHQASSLLLQFTHINRIQKQESDNFLALAKNYVLHGRSVSELCEHNSAVAREFGKSHISVIWKIIKTMYGEEFMQNSINSGSNNRDDVSHNNLPINNIVPSVIGLENTISTLRDIEPDQKSKGGDTPAAQFSGGDDETENEDQVDHTAIYNNGFPTYLNFRTGDDLYFSDFRSGFRSFNHITPQFQDWSLPNEAFPVRHEIKDRSPPPEHYPNHHSPDINEEPHAFQVDDQPITLISVSKPPKKISDIQTATCILIVLGDCRKYLKELDELMQEHWLLGYIDILSRFRLWNIATQVIKLSWLPSVYQLNQQSTRINTNCSKCAKPLQRVGWLCDRCHSSKYA
ncbi:hypothetical protein NQ314_003407, partial [Rhamnusium bicolor]